MKAEYEVDATVKVVAEEGDPADEVFAALSYHYFQLGAHLHGDPHPSIDLVVGHVISSRRSRGRVWKVRLRLRAAADVDVGEEQVRKAVREKIWEAVDSPVDGEITEFTATGVVIDRMEAAGGR